MSTHELYGMTFLGFEVRLPVNHEPKALTKALRKILEDDRSLLLHSVTLSMDHDEDQFLYTVIVAEL